MFGSMSPAARLLILLLLLLSLPLTAQELPFTHYTPNDQIPLPSASVQKLAQDHLGYIWLAFYSSGLTRYDGHAMENYGTADGLLDLTVREVVEDSAHYLWAGSESGLVVSEKPLDDYEPGRRIRFVSRVGGTALPRSRIRRNALVAAAGGWVWVGAQNALVRFRITAARWRPASSTVPTSDRRRGARWCGATERPHRRSTAAACCASAATGTPRPARRHSSDAARR